MKLFKRVGRNLIYKSIGEFFSRSGAFIFYIVIARTLGAELFGKYSFAFAYASIFMIFLDFGLNTVLIRDIATHPSWIGKYIGNMFTLKIILSLVVILLINFTIYLLNYPMETKLIVNLMGIVVIFTAFLEYFFSVLSGLEKMNLEMIVKMINKLLIVIFTIFAISMGFKLIGVIISVICAYGLSVFLSAYFIHRKIEKIKFMYDWIFIKSVARSALLVGITGVIIIVYTKVDIVLLSFFKRPDIEIGWYTAGIKLLETFQCIPALLIGAVLPIFSSLYKESEENLKNFFKKIILITVVLGSFVTLVGLVFSKIIIKIIYGEMFMNTLHSLKIIIFSIVFIFTNSIFMSFLTAIRRERFNIITICICLLCSILLNLIFIPKLGYIGASISKVASEFSLFISNLYFVIKYYKKR